MPLAVYRERFKGWRRTHGQNSPHRDEIEVTRPVYRETEVKIAALRIQIPAYAGPRIVRIISGEHSGYHIPEAVVSDHLLEAFLVVLKNIIRP